MPNFEARARAKGQFQTQLPTLGMSMNTPASKPPPVPPSTVPYVLGSAQTAGAGPLTETTLPPYSVGDYLFVAVVIGSGGTVPATPAGWVLIRALAPVANLGLVIWGRVADGSEGDTLSHGTTTTLAVASALAIAHAITAVAQDAASAADAMVDPPIVCPFVSSTLPDQLLLSVYGLRDTAAFVGGEILPPAGQSSTPGVVGTAAAQWVGVRVASERLYAAEFLGTRVATTTGITAAATAVGANVVVSGV